MQNEFPGSNCKEKSSFNVLTFLQIITKYKIK